MPLHRHDSISKTRLDALSDAMFGVAMTLLVIDIRLPEAFDPKSGAELLHAVGELRSKFLVYLITFFVVGLRWFSSSRLAAGQETVTGQFARWTLLHLFLITCLPFSTMLIGRYAELAPSVWIYAANMALAALVSIRLNMIADREGWHTDGLREGTWALWLLIASALISVAISFFAPTWAMLAYLLNFMRPVLHRHR
ncbi:TMEM175 family protein [Pseudorhodoplanes sp.]|uniref:TMEM175 family protein n=1 Tax=Pseudorhodoplanes sp. TaxID=1934341 RepID=UPI002C20F895|nr:TMEM175 family protein [Pseudorhodoplanes sp.]HWV51441.1 TMEM175 family protein [Pseudorhodoplanes sp.]